jgi:hypothetical protein
MTDFWAVSCFFNFSENIAQQFAALHFSVATFLQMPQVVFQYTLETITRNIR